MMVQSGSPRQELSKYSTVYSEEEAQPRSKRNLWLSQSLRLWPLSEEWRKFANSLNWLSHRTTQWDGAQPLTKSKVATPTVSKAQVSQCKNSSKLKIQWSLLLESAKFDQAQNLTFLYTTVLAQLSYTYSYMYMYM